MKYFWKVDYQLFLPNIHFCNASKSTIHKSKAHFLGILSVIAEDFPKNMWNILIPQ